MGEGLRDWNDRETEGGETGRMERLESRKQLKGALGAIPVCGLITICLEVGLAFLHRGGSAEKHLIHFAILLLAAEGMVLLYGAVPSIRRIWVRIDRRILSAETRKPWADIAYTALAVIMLMHHFIVLLYYPAIPSGASKFAPAWILFAVITVLMGKLWRNRGFWICAVFAAFMFERTYLKEPDMSGETMVYMVSMIYAMVICYGAADVIRPAYRRGALRVLCALWTLAALTFCGAGLYTAWTGETVKNLGEGKAEFVLVWVRQAKWVRSVRLSIFSNSNITGGTVAASAMFALAGFAVSKKALGKVFYAAACFVMMVTNALAVTRSCFAMLSFALAAMVTLGVWGLVKKHADVRGKGRIALAAGLAVCMAGCLWGSYALQQQLGSRFMELRDKGGLIVSTAQAEKKTKKKEKASPTPVPEVAEREIISGDRNLGELITDLDEDDIKKITSGRYSIWKRAFNYAGDHPEVLLAGMSADGSVRTAINRDDHCHNILVQTAMEGGIPGIALYLGLIGYFLFHACRLWRNGTRPLWQRALPVPALAVLLMEMVECLTYFGTGHLPMTVLYFFIGATVAVSTSSGEAE